MIHVVTLTKDELREVDAWAQARHDMNRAQGNKHRHNFKGDGVSIDRGGVAAELAVAITFDMEEEWREIVVTPNFRDLLGDVELIEVRSTNHEDGRLILHRSDEIWNPYVLVTYPEEDLAEQNLIGWIWGRDGKMEEYWWEKAPQDAAFFVPRHELKPIEELLELRDELFV